MYLPYVVCCHISMTAHLSADQAPTISFIGTETSTKAVLHAFSRHPKKSLMTNPTPPLAIAWICRESTIKAHFGSSMSWETPNNQGRLMGESEDHSKSFQYSDGREAPLPRAYRYSTVLLIALKITALINLGILSLKLL